MQLRLPQDKLITTLDKVNDMCKRKKVQLRNLQSLLGLGLLSFCCKAITPGRAFLRRLFDLTKGVTRPSHYIRLNQQSRADLKAWKIFLQSFNGKVLILPSAITTSDLLALKTDASGVACAAVYRDSWIFTAFPPSWQQINIAVKEFLPIVLAVLKGGRSWANTKVLFLCDNMAVVHVINKQTSRDGKIIHLLCSLVLSALQHNISFRAQHVPGKHNIVPDRLSRLQVQAAITAPPSLQPLPTPFPQDWLPWYGERESSSHHTP